MAVALVGSRGAAVQTAATTALTTWAFGQSATAGNLLVATVAVTGSATLPTTPSGWSIAKQVAGTSTSSTIYYRTALGADSVPTIAAITSGVIAGQLSEYSGVITGSTDQTGSSTGTTSPNTATAGGANAATGELILMAAADFRSVARASNDTWTSNDGTVTLAASNNGTSSVNHYSFGAIVGSTATTAQTSVVTLSITTSITGIANVNASFKLGNTRLSSLTANAILRVGQSGSFTADAVVKKTQSGSFTANAIIQRTQVTTLAGNSLGPGGGTSWGNSGAQALAQPFTPAASGVLASVTYGAGRIGSPADNLIIEIQSDASGSPSGVVLATLETVAGSSLATSGAPGTVRTATAGLAVVSGTRYWLVWRRSAGPGTSDYATSPASVVLGDGKYYDGATWGGLATSYYVSAVIVTSRFTADAYIFSAVTGSFTANAILKKTQTGSLTADSVLKRTISGSFTADAVLRRSQATFSETAPLLGTNTGFGSTTTTQVAQSFTPATSGVLESVSYALQKIGSPTDNITVEIQTSASGSPSGVVLATLETFAGSVLTTSPVVRTATTSLRVASGTSYWIVFRRVTPDDTNRYFASRGSAYAGGELQILLGSWASLGGDDLYFDASIRSSFFTADAVLKATQASSFTANAVLKRTQTGSFTANAVLLRTQRTTTEGDTADNGNTAGFGTTGSFEKLAQSFTPSVGGMLQSFTYVLVKEGSPTDNVTVEIQTDSAGSPSGVVLATLETIVGSTLPANFNPPSRTATVSLALVGGTTYWVVFRRSGTLGNTNYYGLERSSSAYLGGVAKESEGAAWVAVAGDFYFEALIRSSFFTADATILRTQTGSLTADAVLKATQASSFTANAIIKVTGWQGQTVEQATPKFSSITFGDTASPTRQSLAQSFLVRSGVINSVAVTLGTGSPVPTDSLVIEIQNDVAGAPGGTVVGTVATVLGSSLPLVSALQTYSGLFIPVTAGSTYWIVVRRSGAIDARQYTLGTTLGNLYANGTLLGYNGSAWASTGSSDAAFTVLAASSPFTADAVTKRTQTGSLTADAVVKATASSSYTANAIIKATQASSFTANAIRLKTVGLLSRSYPQNVSGSSFGRGIGTEGLAQPFTLAVSTTLRSIGYAVYRAGSPVDNVVVELQTTTAGQPSGVVVATLETITGSSLGTNASSVPVRSVTVEIPLAAGTYAIVWRRDGALDDTNRYGLKQSDSASGGLIGSTGSWSAVGSGFAHSLTGDDAQVTADAVLKATQASSFTANAVIKATQASSFTANAILKKTQAGNFTADGVIAVGATTVTSSFTANAVVRRTVASSFAADAVVKRTQSSSLTADAIIRGTASSTLTADSVIRATIASSLTASAVVKRTATATYLADAVLRSTASGSLAVDAVLRATQTGSFTANAVVRRATSVTFTADAVTRRTQSGSVTADAVVKRTATGSLTADAIVRVSVTGSLTANAVIRKTQAVSITADAIVFKTQTGIFTAAAVIMPTLTVNAIVKRTVASSFTANAVVMPTFTANAIKRRTESASFLASAFVQGVGVFATSLDAVIRRTNAQSFTLDAVIQRTESRTFSTEAIVKRTATATLSLSAVLKRTASASFTLDAIQLKTASAQVTAHAVIRTPRTAGFSLDAVLLSPQTRTLSVDARIQGSGAASFSIDAVVLRGRAGSFTADATFRTTSTGSFSAAALIRATRSGSWTSDSLFKRQEQRQLVVDAVFQKTVQGQLTLGAVLRSTHVATLLVEAEIVSAAVVASLTASAVIRRSNSGSFVASAYLYVPPTEFESITATNTADLITANNGAATISAANAAEMAVAVNSVAAIDAANIVDMIEGL